MYRLEKGKNNGGSCTARQEARALFSSDWESLIEFFEQKRKTEQLGQLFSNHFCWTSFCLFILFCFNSQLATDQYVVILVITSTQLMPQATHWKS